MAIKNSVYNDFYNDFLSMFVDSINVLIASDPV